MIDTTRLKAQTDLLTLVSRDTTLKRVATTRGGEYAGPCPFCRDGDDRFRVQPERGLWWCRQCSPDDHWQDAIAYVMKRESVPFAEAAQMLESNTLPVREKLPQREPEPAPETTAIWRATAQAFCQWAAERLWSDTGARALAYLREGRGFTDDTIRRWGLGYNPTDLSRPAERWGFPGKRDVFLQRGIVIPGVVGGRIWYVKTRCATSEDDALARYIGCDRPRQKYPQAPGSHPYLFGADTLADKATAVLTEGEFDAMLLYQEIGHKLPDVGVATLGSASAMLPGAAIRHLLPVPRILIAYDMDAEGQRGAEKIMQVSARMRRIEIPMEGCKDVTDFHKAGGRLRDWIEYNIARLDIWNDAEALRLIQQTFERVAAAYEHAPMLPADLDGLGRAIDDAARMKDMPRLRRAVRDYEARALAANGLHQTGGDVRQWAGEGVRLYD